MHPLFPFFISLAAAATAFVPGSGTARRRIFGTSAILSSATAISVATPVLYAGTSVAWGPILIDRFAAYVIVLISVVGSLAAIASIRYLAHGAKTGTITPAAERTYFAFFPLFLLSMWTAVAADNMALLWIALESTTLTTTLLVAFDRTRGAVEAAWKYILICSTGIILGLLGVLMLIHSGAGTDLGAGALALSSFKAHADSLSVETLKWAFVFLFIGVGTKVGFVPMHTWLPDAHSKTPSPVSAVLSGVLLNVAFVILIRIKLVADAAIGTTAWTETFFLAFGMLSIVVPALIMLVQKNYKRLLAYSSIEHMGLLAFATGLGPPGLIPAMIHMAGHALAKPALFIGAGEFLHETGTASIDEVRGMARRLPKTGVLFFLALLALLAAPPSVLFMSEFAMAAFGMRLHPFMTLTVLALLVIIAYAMMRSTVEMLFSAADAPGAADPRREDGEQWHLANVVMLADIVLGLVFGLAVIAGPGLRFFIVMAESLTTL